MGDTYDAYIVGVGWVFVSEFHVASGAINDSVSVFGECFHDVAA